MIQSAMSKCDAFTTPPERRSACSLETADSPRGGREVKVASVTGETMKQNPTGFRLLGVESSGVSFTSFYVGVDDRVMMIFSMCASIHLGGGLKRTS